MFIAEAATASPAPVRAPQERVRDIRVRPESAGGTLWEGSSFGIGFATDQLRHRTGQRFDQWPVSYQISWDQHIRTIWSGGFTFKSGAWDALPGSGQPDRYPLQVASRVHAGLPLWKWFPESKLSRIVQPYVGGSLGALIFLKERIPTSGIENNPRTEVYAGLGVGTKVALFGSLRLRIGAESWRGFETYNHTAIAYSVELQLGDSGVPYE